MTSAVIKLQFAAKRLWNHLLYEEKGGSEIIALIVIIAIVVALAIAFKDRIGELFGKLWSMVGQENPDTNNISVETGNPFQK
jgi:flagellin-like protein